MPGLLEDLVCNGLPGNSISWQIHALGHRTSTDLVLCYVIVCKTFAKACANSFTDVCIVKSVQYSYPSVRACQREANRLLGVLICMLMQINRPLNVEAKLGEMDLTPRVQSCFLKHTVQFESVRLEQLWITIHGKNTTSFYC